MTEHTTTEGLTEADKTHRRRGDGIHWRGWWYSEASVERILTDRLASVQADYHYAAMEASSAGTAAETAEAERDAARAEVEALRRWKDEALPVIGGLQALGRALEMRLGTTITGPLALEAVEKLKAERDAARSTDFAAVLEEHEGCRMNDSRDGHHESAVTSGLDVWTCGLRVPFSETLEDAERAHVAAAIRAAMGER